jgi:hypothetical protein
MPANVDFDPPPLPLDGDSVPILVYRFNADVAADADPADGQRYQPLPNVYCRSVSRKEGPDPGSARFEYVFSDSDPTSPYPTQFDQVWPLTARGRWVVKNDDRLVVVGVTEKGFSRVIFDGFAQIPQVDLTPDTQSVTFGAVGVASRAWDTPIGGAVYRNADDPDWDDVDNTVETDLPTRFNPDREPNCTPDDKDIGPAKEGYPQFLDEKIVRDPDPRTYWTIGKAVRYLLAVHNDQSVEPLWVKNPDFTSIDNVLKARKPRDDAEFYDPGDASTYEATDIIVRDYEATGKAWPDAVAELCGFAGAVVRFELGQDEQGDPVTTLKCRRGDATKQSVATKDVYLARPGVLDVASANVSELHVSRDSVDLVNAFEIETDPIQVEVSIVLGLGFVPLVGDEVDGTRNSFLSSALANASSDDRAKYRLYVADEAGDGHYDFGTSAFVTGIGAALDLSPIFGEDDEETGPQYVKRLRPADGHALISKDAAGKPRRATLCLSRDYAGAAPAVWDGTGHWQPIAGGWELLKDRFGIYATIDDPEAWDIGAYAGADPQNAGKVLRGVTSQANPSAPGGGPETLNTKRFYLMLTALIDSDLMIAAAASKRDASPTKYERRRRLDAKDHFKQQVVGKQTWYHQEAEPVNARDDTEKAQAHAEAARSAQEFPAIEGSVTIPWLTNAYKLGDRIRKVAGREVSFQANAGSDAEAPRYPYVTAIDYEFSGERQATILHYSDQRSGPQDA